MKKIIFYTFFLFLCANAVTLTAQKVFNGTVVYNYRATGDNAQMMSMYMPEKMIMKYSDKNMMTYMEGGRTAEVVGKIIINGKNQEAFIIKDADRTVYLMDSKEIANSEQPQIKESVRESGSEDILGYPCQKYKVVASQGGQESVQYIWVTNKLKVPDVSMPGMQNMGGGMMLNSAVPGFPMKVEILVPAMNSSIIMTAADLSFSKISQSEFERPAGYAVKPFSAMRGGR